MRLYFTFRRPQCILQVLNPTKLLLLSFLNQDNISNGLAYHICESPTVCAITVYVNCELGRAPTINENCKNPEDLIHECSIHILC